MLRREGNSGIATNLIDRRLSADIRVVVADKWPPYPIKAGVQTKAKGRERKRKAPNQKD
jgi:hypothetical protein